MELLKKPRFLLLLTLLLISIFILFKKSLSFGVDIQGGSVVKLVPEKKNLTDKELDTIKRVLETRFNSLGLSDTNIFYTKALGGQEAYFYIISSSLSVEDIKNFILKEGKFEAKIGNETVFTGENVVCVDCQKTLKDSCVKEDNGYYLCRSQISLELDDKAAKMFANITKNLKVLGSGENSYLNETIDFYLDGKLISNLTISGDLKGREATHVVINLAKEGKSLEETLEKLKKEENIIKGLLESGKLPSKLQIVSSMKYEGKLGEEFLKRTILIGALAILLIAVIIYLKYPHPYLFLAIMFSLISEVILILAFASLINWNLDISALAGIIVAIGTGVDDLIVITDQILRRHVKFEKRVKEAYSLVLFSWITTLVAMLPLLFSEFFFLRGFAFTTIVGITIGVLITRPVYKEIVTLIAEKLEKERI
jgi:preprotein translocase subunit SecD